jgi:hypothetical protein
MRRLLLAYVLLGVAGCSGNGERPPYASPYKVGSGGSSFNVQSGGDNCGPPAPDAGLCGNQILPTQQDRPNLYFIVDASGSMSGQFNDVLEMKYTAAVDAIESVLEQIGHRVSYGAAVFPFNNGSNCGLPGREVFATKAGDSVVCSINGRMGDVLADLIDDLSNRSPVGGTPLSATLSALKPTLTSLPGKTAIILATDGAPNCNPDAICKSDLCELNIDQAVLDDGTICKDPINCCNPAVVTDGNLNCVDSEATNAVLTELLSDGISTYVIGLPGYSSILGAVLDGMAVAGGTPRSTPPLYYEANDPQTLVDTLREIATKIAVSCTITLDDPPPNWGLVNVYLDAQQVPQSTDDGWQQIDERTVEITGTYCTTLQTGNVYQVQITAGCPTYVN